MLLMGGCGVLMFFCCCFFAFFFGLFYFGLLVSTLSLLMFKQHKQFKLNLEHITAELATVLCNEIVCCVFALTSVILPCWSKEEGEVQREATMARSVSTNTMTVVIANFLVTTYARLFPRCT